MSSFPPPPPPPPPIIMIFTVLFSGVLFCFGWLFFQMPYCCGISHGFDLGWKCSRAAVTSVRDFSVSLSFTKQRRHSVSAADLATDFAKCEWCLISPSCDAAARGGALWCTRWCTETEQTQHQAWTESAVAVACFEADHARLNVDPAVVKTKTATTNFTLS